MQPRYEVSLNTDAQGWGKWKEYASPSTTFQSAALDWVQTHPKLSCFSHPDGSCRGSKWWNIFAALLSYPLIKILENVMLDGYLTREVLMCWLGYYLSLRVYQTAVVTPKSDKFLTHHFSMFYNLVMRFSYRLCSKSTKFTKIYFFSDESFLASSNEILCQSFIYCLFIKWR